MEAKIFFVLAFKLHSLASKLYIETFGLGSKFVYKTEEVLLKKVRSAGFEPAIPSLGSSYLDQAGLTSLRFVTDNNQRIAIYSVCTAYSGPI